MQMMNSPIIEFDVHGMRTEEAVAAIQKQVDPALRCIRFESFTAIMVAPVFARLSGKSSVMAGSRR